MSEQFSHVATDYDAQFTHTKIGRYQRGQVLREVEPMLKPDWHVLEVNCGTGEDARWLSERVKSVLATDISPEMVAVAKQKAAEKSNVEFGVLDLNNIESLAPQTFDLIFSNFGGLNCLSPEELALFIQKSHALLNPGGLLMLVIMGRNTLWEKLYFSLKGEKEKAKRRQSVGPVMAHVDGKDVPTWYYSPKEILALSTKHFKKRKSVPIGLFVAPSYLEHFFSNKSLVLRFCALMDEFWLVPFADFADHYLICLEKKAV